MPKWLCLGAIIVLVALLTGCGGGSDSVSVGEGAGTIAASDFNPFAGNGGGPMNLKYFTAPSAGNYEVILTSGPGQDALPSPYIMVFLGHVEANNVSFLGAYNSGQGVAYQNHGDNIATVVLPANANEEFTLAFTSATGNVGSYSYRVVAF